MKTHGLVLTNPTQNLKMHDGKTMQFLLLASRNLYIPMVIEGQRRKVCLFGSFVNGLVNAVTSEPDVR